eukprot:6480309-Amphidinium_carterae.1
MRKLTTAIPEEIQGQNKHKLLTAITARVCSTLRIDMIVLLQYQHSTQPSVATSPVILRTHAYAQKSSLWMLSRMVKPIIAHSSDACGIDLRQ